VASGASAMSHDNELHYAYLLLLLLLFGPSTTAALFKRAAGKQLFFAV
jgi:hypothetical protein